MTLTARARGGAAKVTQKKEERKREREEGESGHGLAG